MSASDTTTRTLPVQLDPRVSEMVTLVREISRQTDAQQMVTDFGDRFRRMFPADGFLAMSRRGLQKPFYRITRSSRFTQPINPWKQSDLLPLLDRGTLGDLLYGDQPVINNDFEADPDDPAYEHLTGFRSFMAVPHYHEGEAFNMAVTLHREPGAFDPLTFADRILTHNLFGRATNNMVIAQKLREANDALDAELKTVGDIQRSLLPQTLPDIPGLSLASHYHTARRAGGDYYDLLPLPDGRWGILVADVSGHGTPAAVVMAVTHALAHSYAGPPCPPDKLLADLNEKLAERYDTQGVMFVTAWYGVYNPTDRSLTYSAAGHPPPRLCRNGALQQLGKVGGLPLGITPHARYESATIVLHPGDRVLLFTDGITEAFNPHREQYGEARLDDLLCNTGHESARDVICRLLDDVQKHAAGTPNEDDQTLLALHVMDTD